jgi:hypothetical protein
VAERSAHSALTSRYNLAVQVGAGWDVQTLDREGWPAFSRRFRSTYDLMIFRLR